MRGRAAGGFTVLAWFAVGLLALGCSSKVVSKKGDSSEDEASATGGSAGTMGGSGGATTTEGTTESGNGTGAGGSGDSGQTAQGSEDVASASSGGSTAGTTSDGSVGGTAEGGSGGSDSGGGTGGGSSGGTGGSGADTCLEDYRCVPDVPADWEGPILDVRSEESRAECPASFPDQEFDAGSSFYAGGDCHCDCTPSASCSAARVEEFSQESCPGSPTSQRTLSSTCEPVSDGIVSTRVVIDPPEATCTPSARDELEAARFGVLHRACSGAVPSGSCSGGSCIPVATDSFHEKHCIFREGDHDCPDGDYRVKSTLGTDIEDTRQCPSTCECEVTDAGKCSAAFRINQTDCSSVVVEDNEAWSGSLGCYNANWAFDASEQQYLNDSTECYGKAVMEGSASAVGTVTVCCL